MIAACQPLDVPPPGHGLGLASNDSPGGSFRERRGWRVVSVPSGPGIPPHCRGQRNDGGQSLRITFLGGEVESGFRLDGIPDTKSLPASEEIVVTFADHEHRSYTAELTNGPSLTVTFPTKRYEEIMYPFAHSRSVELRGRKLGPLGSLEMDGSSWTINATDECRRMKVPPAK